MILDPDTLEWAYRHGAFPMAMEHGEIGWFQPVVRAVIPLNGFHASRSLKRTSKQFQIAFDTDFETIIRRCADRPEGSWINEEIVRAYCEMFRLSKAHSAGAYWRKELVGGVYGVRIERAFMAESMFHSKTDAGKAALWKLIEHLRDQGVELFDVQYMTPHLKTLGAITITHEEYMNRLRRALR